MKFTMETKALNALLAAASTSVDTRSTWDVVKGVRIEARGAKIHLTATDLDKELTMAAPAMVAAEGAALLEHAPLANWVKTLHDGSQIEIAVDEGSLVAKSGRSRYRVPVLPLDGFPKFGEPEDPVRFEIEPGQLARMLRLTVGFASTSDLDYYLNGVWLHRRDGFLRCAATQKQSLGIAGIPSPEGSDGMPDVILPSDTAKALLTLLGSAETLRVDIGSNVATFDSENWRLASKLIDGEYPDITHFERQTRDRTIYCDALTLAAAVRRVAIASALIEKKTRRIYLDFADGTLSITAGNDAGAESNDALDAELIGAPIRLSFNSAYLHGLLETFRFERVEISTGIHNDAPLPLLLRAPDAPECDKTFIAPMRG